MRLDADIKLDFKDVLFRPKRSTLKSRAEVDLVRTYVFRNSKATYTGVPVIAANMDTVGTFHMATALAKHQMFTAIHKHYTVEEWSEFAAANPDVLKHVAVSSGIGSNDMARLRSITTAVPSVRYICLDVANGYSEEFVNFVRKTREEFPEHTIMAGNVVTGEMVEELILSGADIVKVGIGPAFGAGADFVMLGGMLAGHDESDGELIEERGKKYKLFYGMSSRTAMDKHHGGVANYRASEGKTVRVPYRGPVDSTCQDILGGVRSTCTYVGAATLKELSKRTTFIRVTQQVNTVFGNEES